MCASGVGAGGGAGPAVCISRSGTAQAERRSGRPGHEPAYAHKTVKKCGALLPSLAARLRPPLAMRPGPRRPGRHAGAAACRAARAAAFAGQGAPSGAAR